MAEFLEVVESIRAEEASVQKLFSGDGQGVRSARKGPEYMKGLAEAASFIAEVYQGRRPMHHLKEAMTTSDFPLLFADVLDRQLLAAYRETPQHWTAIAKRADVTDFRNVKRFPRGLGGASVLAQVATDASYPEDKIADSTPYTYAVKKYGRRMPFAWETLVNDDLDALKDVPARFGRATRMTEEKFCTELYADANGPHATFFSSGNANIVTGNPVLSIAGLQTAMTVLGAMTDGEGNPIVVDMAVLVVPPALSITADNILNAIQLELTTAGGVLASSTEQRLITQNWMKNKLTKVVNPWLPLVSSSADGNTAWYLFAAPAADSAALEMGFLRGHSEPEIFMKAPNATLVGGGASGVMDGDFDTDSVQYKVRHVLGGCTLDPKLAVASEGDGS